LPTISQNLIASFLLAKPLKVTKTSTAIMLQTEQMKNSAFNSFILTFNQNEFAEYSFYVLGNNIADSVRADRVAVAELSRRKSRSNRYQSAFDHHWTAEDKGKGNADRLPYIFGILNTSFRHSFSIAPF
jgi:hypothetical protein